MDYLKKFNWQKRYHKNHKMKKMKYWKNITKKMKKQTAKLLSLLLVTCLLLGVLAACNKDGKSGGDGELLFTGVVNHP